jgi:hypothetical protein
MSWVVAIDLLVTRPFLLRALVVVLNLTIVSRGEPLMVMSFLLAVEALGMVGGSDEVAAPSRRREYSRWALDALPRRRSMPTEVRSHWCAVKIINGIAKKRMFTAYRRRESRKKILLLL